MELYYKLQFFKEILGYIFIGGYFTFMVIVIIVNAFYHNKDEGE